tara:strand:- start:2774 stop:3700 length:927 start_codon:yes stop_codon:yes gene_type:complete
VKLIIHAGAHKTATTTFQYLCGKNINLLKRNYIYYPIIQTRIEDLGEIIFNKLNCTSQPLDIKVDNHSYLAWMIQFNQLEFLTFLLKRFFNEAQTLKCKYVLLSGEDFENVLIDYSMYETFESIAQDCGYKNIEWIFVKRNPYDYLLSLYSELAVNGFCYNLYDIYEKIIHDGYFRASNRIYDWIFVFDLNKRFELFNKKAKSISKLFSFEDFLNGFPGQKLLENYLDSETIVKLQVESLSLPRFRVSRSKEKVELLYICAFLDMKATQKNYNSNREIIDALVRYRLKAIESKKEIIRDTLLSKFEYK